MFQFHWLINNCLLYVSESHDAHIFSLKEPLSDSAMQLLDYPINLREAENGKHP